MQQAKDCLVLFRCNYTDKNILSVKKAIDDLSNIDSKENLVFSVQRIWQEEDSSELDY